MDRRRRPSEHDGSARPQGAPPRSEWRREYPNHANYDESTANPFPNLPDVLTLKNGEKISTAEIWWTDRRPEIVEDFEREVLGRVPPNVPRVTWSTSRTVSAIVGGRAVTARQLIGHVDNSAYPLINHEIPHTDGTRTAARTARAVAMV